MRFSSALLAGSLTLPLCFASFAQSPATTPASDSAPAAQQQPAAQPAPAQTTDQTNPPLKLESLPADPHTPTPEEQAAAEAARNRAAVARLATLQANWGPPGSTPGYSLTLKEVNRNQTPAGTEVTYRLAATGFTPQTRLTLMHWPLNDRVNPVMNNVTIDASGQAICADAGLTPTPTATTADQAPSCAKTTQINMPIEIKTTAAPGEAVRLALVAPDRKGAEAQAIPFPVAAENNGCKLQVLRGSRDNELVLVEGDGFKPTAQLDLGAETYGVKEPLHAKIDDKGHFAAAVTPYAKDHDSGDTVIFAQSGACTATLSFHWGKSTYKAQ
ncbi:hypothetical protein [Silvibacterium acidisoli]|uniref:hypothetical protein n=1 Tax=Acidobacteriaceae bacterium ZG23-2 TaxID=2883246 RepID=UPI00406D029C